MEEVGVPHKLQWNKCKLETVSFGHGITTTPLQATALYAAMVNGGKIVIPSLIKERKIENPKKSNQHSRCFSTQYCMWPYTARYENYTETLILVNLILVNLFSFSVITFTMPELRHAIRAELFL